MQKYLLFFFVQFGLVFVLFGQQKPFISFETLNKWPILKENVEFSQNGQFFAFTIDNLPINNSTLIVRNVQGTWEKKISSSSVKDEFYFSLDSKIFCWKSADSLFLQSTGNDKYVRLDVSFYKFPKYKKGEWIVYKEKSKRDELVLRNLNSGKTIVFANGEDVFFDDNGNNVVVAIKKNDRFELEFVNLKKEARARIYSANANAKLSSFKFDSAGEQTSFIINVDTNSTVYYFKTGMKTAVKRLHQSSSILAGNMLINRVAGFSKNGKWLFINLTIPNETRGKIDGDKVSVDVWTYRDIELIPEQEIKRVNEGRYLVISIESSDEGFLLNADGLKAPHPISINGDNCILSSDTVENREYWWMHSEKPELFLVSLSKQTRKKLPFFTKFLQVSPESRWIIYWKDDGVRNDFYSYEISTGFIKNLTSSLSTRFAMENIASVDSTPVGIAGWYRNDEAVMIYDNYDIWKIDPTGMNKPENLTKGFGEKNKIKIRFFEQDRTVLKDKVYSINSNWILSGYNEITKQNGFLKLNPKASTDPEILSMDDFSWYKTPSQIGNSAKTSNMLIPPIEGGKGNGHGWILMGESATEFPNYYYSKDLKSFTRLTNFAPHKLVNWLTTEILSWKLPDGKMAQGILYKPEDFDSAKQYPVIVNYYERYSGWLNSFDWPQLTKGRINIPWFVSRGYLVFVPDIYFSVGSKTGISSCEHAYISVVSGVEYLNRRLYVDKSSIGIQGHSFGGLLTNYLLTHANFFAAAAEGAGFTDEMSCYLSLIGASFKYPVDIKSAQSHKELDHGLYGDHPWNFPDLYRKNSPVWDAHKAASPLLIHHNKNDQQVPWRQGVEMYMALRRLGKPCWMLQYDNSNHGAIGNDAKDYTIRLEQYFDHYLKGQPAPRWMTQGIPAKLKQVESRYELDPSGNCSKDCKVCKKWNGSTAAKKENGTTGAKE